MKEQEAIEQLKTMYPKMCKMVDGRYKGGYDNHDSKSGMAIDVAIKALEKQMPKKPKIKVVNGKVIITNKSYYDEVRLSLNDAKTALNNCYLKGRADAVDEFLYFVGEKLATISMDPAERAELYALLQIKANELKEKKE